MLRSRLTRRGMGPSPAIPILAIVFGAVSALGSTSAAQDAPPELVVFDHALSFQGTEAETVLVRFTAPFRFDGQDRQPEIVHFASPLQFQGTEATTQLVRFEQAFSFDGTANEPQIVHFTSPLQFEGADGTAQLVRFEQAFTFDGTSRQPILVRFDTAFAFDGQESSASLVMFETPFTFDGGGSQVDLVTFDHAFQFRGTGRDAVRVTFDAPLAFTGLESIAPTDIGNITAGLDLQGQTACRVEARTFDLVDLPDALPNNIMEASPDLIRTLRDRFHNDYMPLRDYALSEADCIDRLAAERGSHLATFERNQRQVGFPWMRIEDMAQGSADQTLNGNPVIMGTSDESYYSLYSNELRGLASQIRFVGQVLDFAVLVLENDDRIQGSSMTPLMHLPGISRDGSLDDWIAAYNAAAGPALPASPGIALLKLAPILPVLQFDAMGLEQVASAAVAGIPRWAQVEHRLATDIAPGWNRAYQAASSRFESGFQEGLAEARSAQPEGPVYFSIDLGPSVATANRLMSQYAGITEMRGSGPVVTYSRDGREYGAVAWPSLNAANAARSVVIDP